MQSLVVSADEGDHGEEELEEEDEDGVGGAAPLRQVFRARLQLGQLDLQERNSIGELGLRNLNFYSNFGPHLTLQRMAAAYVTPWIRLV